MIISVFLPLVTNIMQEIALYAAIYCWQVGVIHHIRSKHRIVKPTMTKQNSGQFVEMPGQHLIKGTLAVPVAVNINISQVLSKHYVFVMYQNTSAWIGPNIAMVACMGC